MGYVAGNGKKHTYNLAENFAKDKSGGKKVTYTNLIAVKKNGGWRYSYGNQFLCGTLSISIFIVTQFDDETVQAIMNEALKYERLGICVWWQFSPNHFLLDCSGLDAMVFWKGWYLFTERQRRHNMTQHNISRVAQAKPGDLVFFHSPPTMREVM